MIDTTNNGQEAFIMYFTLNGVDQRLLVFGWCLCDAKMKLRKMFAGCYFRRFEIWE